MALTINHPAARKAWAMELARVIPQYSFFYQNQFIKPEADAEGAILVEMNELATKRQDGKASGYEITYDLEGPLTGFPTPGDKPIKGKEKKLSLFTDKIQINQDRFSVISEGNFSDQLVPYTYRQRARNRMGQYWPIYFDERVVAKLSGSLGDGTWLTIDSAKATSSARDIEGSVASDGNDLRAPSSNRIIYANGLANQAAIGTSDKISLDVVDRALLQAVRTDANSTLLRLVPQITVNGRQAYVLMMDYVQARDLAQSMAGRWYDIEKAKVQGGMADSALLKGSLGVYKSPLGVDVILYAHPRMVKFSAATTGGQKVARALLLGQSAGRVAYGRDSEKLPSYSWQEETDDRGNQLVITSGTVSGIQKSAFTTTETGNTREDWGVIAIDTYADW